MATLSVMTLGPSPQKMSTTCVLLTTQAQQASQNSPSPQKNAVMINNNIKKQDTTNSNGVTTMSSPNSDMLRCKRRINFTHLGYTIPHAQPAAVARRNARERNRVKQVNNGFATLRQHIPFTTRNKKMSKVETLRCAVEYIKNLQDLLDENDGALLHHHSSATTAASTTTTTTSTGSDQGYYSSPEAVQGIADQCYTTAPRGVQPLSSLSPPCSEASSPTPSYASEGSSSYAATSVYENYENYEPMSPEDEELLDVISWWQQSQ